MQGASARIRSKVLPFQSDSPRLTHYAEESRGILEYDLVRTSTIHWLSYLKVPQPDHSLALVYLFRPLTSVAVGCLPSFSDKDTAAAVRPARPNLPGMAILLFLGTPILAFVVWTTFSIFRNYQLARRIGLPIIISPVSTLNPFWILLWRGFPAVLSLKHLPWGLGTWARCTSMGWAFQDKHKLHAEIGPLFTLVTPAANEVTVADPEAAHAVLARRKDYIKPAAMYGMCLRRRGLGRY